MFKRMVSTWILSTLLAGDGCNAKDEDSAPLADDAPVTQEEVVSPDNQLDEDVDESSDEMPDKDARSYLVYDDYCYYNCWSGACVSYNGYLSCFDPSDFYDDFASYSGSCSCIDQCKARGGTPDYCYYSGSGSCKVQSWCTGKNLRPYYNWYTGGYDYYLCC